MQALFWHHLQHFVATFSSPSRERGPAGAARGDFHSEHLARMGALAAGAVHELCSPLTTIAVLVEEMKQQPDANELPMLAENLRVMSDQIETCRHILSRLAYAVEGSNLPGNGERAASIRPCEVTNKEWTRLTPSNESAVSRSSLPLFSERV